MLKGDYLFTLKPMELFKTEKVRVIGPKKGARFKLVDKKIGEYDQQSCVNRKTAQSLALKYPKNFVIRKF